MVLSTSTDGRAATSTSSPSPCNAAQHRRPAGGLTRERTHRRDRLNHVDSDLNQNNHRVVGPLCRTPSGSTQPATCVRAHGATPGTYGMPENITRAPIPRTMADATRSASNHEPRQDLTCTNEREWDPPTCWRSNSRQAADNPPASATPTRQTSTDHFSDFYMNFRPGQPCHLISARPTFPSPPSPFRQAFNHGISLPTIPPTLSCYPAPCCCLATANFLS